MDAHKASRTCTNSERPKSTQRERVARLIHLLNDLDQSVRLTSADELAEIREVSQEAVPSLVDTSNIKMARKVWATCGR